MSFNANKIIRINTRISPQGLSTANFGSAMLIVPKSDTSSLPENTYKTYSDIQGVATDFVETTEAYKCASVWLGGTPTVSEIMIWVRDPLDESWGATLNKIRNKTWWYWTFVTSATYEQEEDVKQIAEWCEANSSMFANCQTGASAESIRDELEDGDIASELTKLGYRHCFTACHATDAYSGVYLAKHFARVNYSAQKSTITGEYKKSSGLLSESLEASEYSAMEKDTKKACFYTVVDLQGSTDSGRWLNTWTHSTYGEWIDDVVNLDAFVNALNVGAYNLIANQTTKLPQTSVGQAMVIGAVKAVCEQFISNGFLGERNYTDPDDAQEKYTRGFEILTKPEDILSLSTSDRAQRKCAPILVRVFRAGAIHTADIDIDVY